MALESLACCMSYGKWRRLRPRRVCPAPAAHCGAPTVSVDDSSHLIHFALDVLAVGFLMKVGEEFLRTYPREIAYTAAYVASAGVVLPGWSCSGTAFFQEQFQKSRPARCFLRKVLAAENPT
jgi:hypothetical protein